MHRRLFPVKWLLLIIPTILAGAGVVLWTRRTPVPAPGQDTGRDPEGRVARARERCSGIVRDHFGAAAVPYPPHELFLRVFKREAVLEAWARPENGPFRLIHSYPITSSPGHPGPKRREGDRQAPEGVYTIDRFNPLSLYHLSLRVNYPNASDLILGDREKPGFDIYLHGGGGSVGCVPLGDAAIEEVYVMAVDAGNRDRIPIHMFPARMAGTAWEEFVAPFRVQEPGLAGFWEQLQPVYDAFERTRQVPAVSVDADGRYRIK